MPPHVEIASSHALGRFRNSTGDSSTASAGANTDESSMPMSPMS
ncbi:MAG: hypothetical protein QM736_25155 [Vicinamibacterales bacterium]